MRTRRIIGRVGRVARLSGGGTDPFLPPVTSGLLRAYTGKTLGANGEVATAWVPSFGSGTLDLSSGAASATVSSGKKRLRWQGGNAIPFPSVPGCVVAAVIRRGTGGTMFTEATGDQSALFSSNLEITADIGSGAGATIVENAAADTAIHVFIVQLGADWRFYLDGTDITDVAAVTDPWGDDFSLSGLVDEANGFDFAAVAFYSSARNATERAALTAWGLTL